MSKLNRFLEGVRIVDLSRHLPGPLATLLMADMGAEIVKIEPPGGEEMVKLGPKGPDGRSLYYLAVNAGKATTQIDLREDAGRERLLSYVAEADVVIESFRAGVMERLGVGYETLRARKPDLIYCAMSGFGQQGPYAQRAGHDMNYLALNGVLSLGEGRSRPIRHRPIAAPPCSRRFPFWVRCATATGRERGAISISRWPIRPCPLRPSISRRLPDRQFPAAAAA